MVAQRPRHIKKSDDFPRLGKKDHLVTSNSDGRYNCIAFAADVTSRKYWPNYRPDYFWPKGIPYSETIEAFEALFQSINYEKAPSGQFEADYDRVAIFVDGRGKPTHAAKQIGRGKWASKLGDWYDIEHELGAVGGGTYGEVAFYMRRHKDRRP